MSKSWRRDEFHKALTILLLEYRPRPASMEDFYQNPFANVRRIYVEDDDGELSLLTVSESAWLTFLQSIDEIFQRKVQTKIVSETVLKHLQQLVTVVDQLPFTMESATTNLSSTFDNLDIYFETQATALFPVYNLRCSQNHSIELPLANAVLHSGHRNSDLAKKVQSWEPIKKRFADVSQCSFLSIPVSGDPESMLAQSVIETENAQRVLRFVTTWQSDIGENQVTWSNPASEVTLWEMDLQKIVIFHSDSDRVISSRSSRQSSLHVSDGFVQDARKIWGLDAINHHFAHENEMHSVSKRVRQALTWFDNGAFACTDWEALYRFIVCVEISVTTKRDECVEVLLSKVKLLIKYGKPTQTHRDMDDNLETKSEQTYDEWVEQFVNPFAQFYKRRNRILHGYFQTEDNIRASELHDVRQLAHNTVRTLSDFAQKYSWHDTERISTFFRATRSLDQIRALSDKSKIKLAECFESLRTEFYLIQDQPDGSQSIVCNLLNRLAVCLSNNQPIDRKVAKIQRQLKKVVEESLGDSPSFSLLAEIVGAIGSQESQNNGSTQ